MPKERRVLNFLNWKLNFKKPYSPQEENVLTVVTELKATKPEIKQYIEKVYGLKVHRVNTLIQMGKFKSSGFRSSFSIKLERFKESDFKKAYVYLDEQVPEAFRYTPEEKIAGK